MLHLNPLVNGLRRGAPLLALITVIFGSSTGKFSEEAAKAEAIKICTDFGNSDCEVNFTYKNQCVAVVQAAKGRTGGKIISAATKEIAERSALQKCAEASGAKCVVRGTDCSDPFFKKY